MSVLVCSDRLILFISSSHGFCTWKKLLITVNTLADLILMCPFPAEESSSVWKKLHKTEQNKSCCESQGVCHLPGCEAQLNKNRGLLKVAERPLLCEQSHEIRVLASVTRGQRSGQREHEHKQSMCAGPSAPDFMVTETGQEMCVCTFVPVSLQSPSASAKRRRKMMQGGKGRGPTETVLGITLTRKGFFQHCAGQRSEMTGLPQCYEFVCLKS